MITEVTAYSDRLDHLFALAETLVKEDYYRKDEVQMRSEAIQAKWRTTRELLDERGRTLQELLLLKVHYRNMPPSVSQYHLPFRTLTFLPPHTHTAPQLSSVHCAIACP
jgi:hypothetical protein